MLVKSLESGKFLNIIKVASFKNTNFDSLGVEYQIFHLTKPVRNAS